jgi:hypothetical protein
MTDFHETTNHTERYRCPRCDFDICGSCFADKTPREATQQQPLEARSEFDRFLKTIQAEEREAAGGVPFIETVVDPTIVFAAACRGLPELSRTQIAALTASSSAKSLDMSTSENWAADATTRALAALQDRLPPAVTHTANWASARHKAPPAVQVRELDRALGITEARELVLLACEQWPEDGSRKVEEPLCTAALGSPTAVLRFFKLVCFRSDQMGGAARPVVFIPTEQDLRAARHLHRVVLGDAGLGAKAFTQQLTEHAMRSFELMSLGQNVVLGLGARGGAPDEAAQAAAQGERLRMDSMSPVALGRLASIEREMTSLSPRIVGLRGNADPSPLSTPPRVDLPSPASAATPIVEAPPDDDVEVVSPTATAKPKKATKAVQLPIKELPDLEVLVCPRVDFADWVLKTILTRSKRPNAITLATNPAADSSLSSSASSSSSSELGDDESVEELGLGGGVEGYLGWFRRIVRCAASSNMSIKGRCLTLLSSVLARLSYRLSCGSPLIHRFLAEVRAVQRLELEQVTVERFGTEKRERARVVFSKLTCALFEWQATLRAVQLQHGMKGDEELRAPQLRIVDKMSTSLSLAWTSTRTGDAADVDSFSFVLEMGTLDSTKQMSSGAKRAQQMAKRLRKAQLSATGGSDAGEDVIVDAHLEDVRFREVYRGPSLRWTNDAPVSATETHYFRIKTVLESQDKVSAWSEVTPLMPDRVIEHTSWDPMPAMLLQCDLRDDGRTAFLPNDPPYFPTLSGKTFWSSGIHTWRIKVMALKGPVHLGVVMEGYDMTRPVGFDDKGWGLDGVAYGT